jgi:hydrogenase expression/formation protein HypE
MLTLLLPEGTDEAGVEEIMRQAAEAADELNVDIIGGHTEITASVNKPVIVSTAIGKAAKGSVKDGADLKYGDSILLTKLAGLEGTGIIATDFGEELSGVLTVEEIFEAQQMLSLVSVVREGVVAGEMGFSAMHDVTEGGVLGAVWEICHIADMGAILNEESIPVAPVTQRICGHFHMDPLRLISSGAMLIVVDAEDTAALENAIRKAGIRVTRIGEIRDRREGIKLVKRDGSIVSVDPPTSDEIYKL